MSAILHTSMLNILIIMPLYIISESKRPYGPEESSYVQIVTTAEATRYQGACIDDSAIEI